MVNIEREKFIKSRDFFLADNWRGKNEVSNYLLYSTDADPASIVHFIVQLNSIVKEQKEHIDKYQMVKS